MLFTTSTLNTWKCDGEYLKRLPLIINDISNNQPLVFCCQEVFSSEDSFYSTEKYISEKLNLKSYYYASRFKVRECENKMLESYSGLAVFTNLKVTQHKKIKLPSNLTEDGERTAQIISINYNDNKIGIINTHLTHLKQKDNLRLLQIKAIFNAIDYENFDTIILHGDLNDSPDSKTINHIKKLGFTSCFENYPKTRGEKCIDYIFYKSKRGTSIKNSEVIFNKPSVEGIYPSDHFGLFATLLLANG